MAEHSESTELFLQDRSLISSTGANDPLKVEAAGGKSPGELFRYMWRSRPITLVANCQS